MDIGRGLWVGLSGGIATGKSTACKYLTKLGYPIIDADKISHSLLDQGGQAVELIVKEFGSSVLTPEKSISRPKLSTLVFNEKALLQSLNDIVHPLVRKITNEKKNEFFLNGEKLIFNDVPLLFENSLQDNYDKTVLIYANEKTQLSRLKIRNNFSEKEAVLRIQAQMDIEKKRNLCDFVVDNSGDINGLYFQLDELVQKLILKS